MEAFENNAAALFQSPEPLPPTVTVGAIDKDGTCQDPKQTTKFRLKLSENPADILSFPRHFQLHENLSHCCTQ